MFQNTLGIPFIQILFRNLLYGLELIYGNRFFKSGAHCVRNVHIVLKACTLYGKRAHCIESVHIVWEACTLHWKCAHCMKSVHIAFKVCTLYGKCAHCIESVHIVCEAFTFYVKCAHCMGSDNNHFTFVTITFISTQNPLFRPYKATCFDPEGHIKAFWQYKLQIVSKITFVGVSRLRF